jgi:HK97 family phage major capsid protein
VFSVPNAETLGQVSLEADPADPTWTTELLIGSEDSTMAFGKRTLTPHPLAQFIKVSNTLLRKTDAERLVRERLAYKIAVVAESAYMTGTGSGQPLGIFVTSSDGIPSTRNTTAASTTVFTADELVNVKYALKPQYRGPASWILHRDVVKYCAKLKDGEGRYLLQPMGFAGQMAETILGIPFNESEYAPSTFTSGLYLAALGDWSFYYIADSLDISIQRLVELYAATNQTGFISRYEGDGMPVLGEAFSRLILGT